MIDRSNMVNDSVIIQKLFIRKLIIPFLFKVYSRVTILFANNIGYFFHFTLYDKIFNSQVDVLYMLFEID